MLTSDVLVAAVDVDYRGSVPVPAVTAVAAGVWFRGWLASEAEFEAVAMWLGPVRDGLGAHLHAALGGRTAVVGAAKKPFAGATDAPTILPAPLRKPESRW